MTTGGPEYPAVYITVLLYFREMSLFHLRAFNKFQYNFINFYFSIFLGVVFLPIPAILIHRPFWPGQAAASQHKQQCCVLPASELAIMMNTDL